MKALRTHPPSRAANPGGSLKSFVTWRALVQGPQQPPCGDETQVSCSPMARCQQSGDRQSTPAGTADHSSRPTCSGSRGPPPPGVRHAPSRRGSASSAHDLSESPAPARVRDLGWNCTEPASPRAFRSAMPCESEQVRGRRHQRKALGALDTRIAVNHPTFSLAVPFRRLEVLMPA